MLRRLQAIASPSARTPRDIPSLINVHNHYAGALHCFHSYLILRQPASSRAPFISIDHIHKVFEFRVLRQNRRINVGDVSRKDELENFQKVLHDVSVGAPTPRVRKFIIDCFDGKQIFKLS